MTARQEGRALRCATPDDTRALGRALASWVRAGDLVALNGDLGAGKTCLVQGLAAGLGVTGRVTSPTFVIVKQYDADLPIVHVDAYRLERVGDLRDLGDEVFDPEVVTLGEWADAVGPALPEDRLDVTIVIDRGADGPGADASVEDRAARTITLTPRGTCIDRLADLPHTAPTTDAPC